MPLNNATVLRQVLTTGTLTLETPDPAQLFTLSGFGSRQNLKRGFVFVSKVLGKHYPVRPTQALATYQQLAARIQPLLKPGPTLVIGFAETATGLGQGVYEQLDLTAGFYIHTTRYRLNQPVWVRFEEEHSHATAQVLYQPLPPLQAICSSLVNVVLIDDEFSTGKTVANLLTALKTTLPSVQRWIAASLLNWSPAPMPDLYWVSLHQGRFWFTPNPDNAWPTAPPAAGVTPALDTRLPYNFGRLGIRALKWDWSRWLQRQSLQPGEAVLCLGTSELNYPAYQLATWLETQGVEAYIQATTRSPLNVEGEIHNQVTFMDNYGENIYHYVYNLVPYSKILVCYETQSLPASHDLLTALQAYSPEIIPLFLKPASESL